MWDRLGGMFGYRDWNNSIELKKLTPFLTEESHPPRPSLATWASFNYYV